MFLSRLILNPESRAAQRDLGDCHDLHRTLMKAFPSTPAGVDPRGRYGVLHRVDLDSRAGVPTVLVQSLQRPDWRCLAEWPGYLWPRIDDNPGVKSVEPAYANLNEGRVLVFRLRANPTRKVHDDPARPNGRREPLRTAEEQIDWLRRKTEQGGFELLTVRLSNETLDLRTTAETARTIVKGTRSDRKMTFHSVLFEGRLKITDLGRFQQTLRAGIGPAKAYGFGLLSIRGSS